MAGVTDLDKFSESGRGLPVALSRPQGALPYSPLVRHAYADEPIARLGWGQGLIRVADVTLEPPRPLARDASPAEVARRLVDDESGFVAVCRGPRLEGVVYADRLLQVVADGRIPSTIEALISSQIPTCAPHSALVDAVRQMIACYLRKVPVVGDAGELLGLLTLSEAAAAQERDPAVADLLDRFARSPSLFARPWR